MKTFNLIMLLSFLICLLGCKKEKVENTEHSRVESYIQLLKTNGFKEYTLPDFSYSDIPELLKYRNETLLITDFPQNPLSSYYQKECTLGMYALWTIESIRIGQAEMKRKAGFPSFNPILQERNAQEMKLISDHSSQTIVAKAYVDWWENNKDQSFEITRNIDPLASTAFMWH